MSKLNILSVIPNQELLVSNNTFGVSIADIIELTIIAIISESDLLGSLGISFFSCSKNVDNPFFIPLFVKYIVKNINIRLNSTNHKYDENKEKIENSLNLMSKEIINYETNILLIFLLLFILVCFSFSWFSVFSFTFDSDSFTICFSFSFSRFSSKSNSSLYNYLNKII